MLCRECRASVLLRLVSAMLMCAFAHAFQPLGALITRPPPCAHFPQSFSRISNWKKARGAPPLIAQLRMAEDDEEPRRPEVDEIADTVKSASAPVDLDVQVVKLRAILQDHVREERFTEAAQAQREIQALERGLVKGVEAPSGGRVAGRPERESGGRAMLTETRGPMESFAGSRLVPKVKMVLTDDERRRDDEEPDDIFYSKPRLVLHVDQPFAERLQGLYARRIMAGSAVLDLGASCATFLPEDVEMREVVGLGMNWEELNSNEGLSRRLVQDLNAEPLLPFPDASFDAVVCSSAIQYFTNPEQVLAETARVLRPGGVVILSFTDKCFDSKVPLAWKARGNLARAQLIQDCTRAAGGFTAPELIWEVSQFSPIGQVVPAMRGTLGGDPFIAVVAYKGAPPPGWAMRVDGDSAKGGSLAGYGGGPGQLLQKVPLLKGLTPFAASYVVYLLASKLLLH
mmetsp:Transcript_5354/g.11884  ORF Transcript_5354/g.11884 Transcript_5354/m.11884 type:complete len:457 (+) Transcript_5354:932-2302(+)